MLKMPYHDMLKKIQEKSQISEQEIERRIKEKMDKLSGLISKEGAAHIVANELGIKLFEEITGKVKIKDMLVGMRSCETAGRVQANYGANEFDTGERKGKVGNMLIGDETGVIRLVVWGSKAEMLAGIKENDIVKVKNAYVKENQGRKEIHMGDRGELLINPPGEEIAEVKQNATARKFINQLEPNDSNVELLATIVQAFDLRFFEICPECSRRARLREDKFYCDQHNEVKPYYAYLLNLSLDDGTGNMRAVLFRNQVDNLLKKSTEEVLTYRDFPEKFEEVKTGLIGETIKLVGRVNRNEMFDRTEFVANRVITEIDAKEEIEKLEAMQ
ncbi:DUF2240 family protein [Candidatus Woesearchaeota archaeon]|nr:DUF2240 family protein [Candidatus Woesearchaeota archaeon]